MFFGWCLARLLMALFGEDLRRTKPEAMEALNTISEAFREVLSNLPNRIPQAVSEMEKIERILVAAEGGTDWAALK
jgi:hypothetical protein